MRRIAIVVMVAGMMLAACGAGEHSPLVGESGVEVESVDPTHPKEGSGDPIADNGEPLEPLAFATSDLASRLGVSESAITVISFEEVTWPDGSLGCPDPNASYTQALVNGSLIVLEVDGTSYEYHSRLPGDPFYCATPTSPVEGGYGDV